MQIHANTLVFMQIHANTLTFFANTCKYFGFFSNILFLGKFYHFESKTWCINTNVQKISVFERFWNFWAKNVLFAQCTENFWICIKKTVFSVNLCKYIHLCFWSKFLRQTRFLDVNTLVLYANACKYCRFFMQMHANTLVFYANFTHT